jgi:hypothetical protein
LGAISALFDQISQSAFGQNLYGIILSFFPEFPQPADILSGTVIEFTQAFGEVNGALNAFQKFFHRYLISWFGKGKSSSGTAMGYEQTGSGQTLKNLGQKFLRDILCSGNL